ncbi:MAG: HPF/RaiA family ribosome-associated protein [Bacteroidota bacterium]
MQIQINTDRNIKGHETFTTEIDTRVTSAFSRFSERISRLEIHLSDENGSKSGLKDKRCLLEARIEGRQPIAVTHLADSLDQAIDGAVEKMIRLIENTLDRTLDRQRRETGQRRTPERKED